MTVRLGISEFARRYSAEGRHAHFEGTWEALLALIQQNWESRKANPNNPNVVVVPMPPESAPRFYATTVSVTPETRLSVEFKPRRDGEEPFLDVLAAGGAKQPAAMAEIVLYHRDVLDGEVFSPEDAQWLVVAIKAYPTAEPEPMHPITMARNLLGRPGGTVPEVPYSPQQFAEAILYWSKHVSVG
jgi:hypothetical protein